MLSKTLSFGLLVAISHGATYFDNEGRVIVQDLGLPVTDGLHAHFTAGTFDGSSWYDMSGNGRHSSNEMGSMVLETDAPGAAGNDGAYTYVKGGTDAGLVFTDVPSQFTICSTSRWTSDSNQFRVLTSSLSNNIHGHHARGRGLAYYETWKTTQDNKGTRTDWLVFCGDNAASGSVVLADGNNIAITNGGYVANLAVNMFNGGQEKSEWGVGDVIIYDGHLTEAQMLAVSNYLQDRLDAPAPTSAPPLAPTTPSSTYSYDTATGDVFKTYLTGAVKKNTSTNRKRWVVSTAEEAATATVTTEDFSTSDGSWTFVDGGLQFTQGSKTYNFPDSCRCQE